jgi:hypothetical protein
LLRSNSVPGQAQQACPAAAVAPQAASAQQVLTGAAQSLSSPQADRPSASP